MPNRYTGYKNYTNYKSYRIYSAIRLALAIAVTAIAPSACTDDCLYDGGAGVPDGTPLPVTIEGAFEPFASQSVNDSRAGAPAGDIMSEISDVALFAYDADGRLMAGYPQELEFTDSDINDENRNGADATTGSTTEASTRCLRKQLTLAAGEYYLVAVANFGTYDGGTSKTSYQALVALGEDKYNTLDKLRSLRRAWDSDHYSNNRMMMGYFTDKAITGDVPSSSSEFRKVRINAPDMTLRAWLRRAASKVTVDFDGSGLRENIRIYVRDVKVHDIAGDCNLGFGISKDNDKITVLNNTIKSTGGLIHDDGHAITFGRGDDYRQWPVIAKGSPYLKDNKGERLNLHSNSSPSLFFYENMQGNSPQSKGPILDMTEGDVANSNTVKDNMPNATYIEVTAYYESTASGNVSNGMIKYRFVLGKDADRDCNVERNHHYKVTLKFNGNANEYSWHIDYLEEPDSWDVPQPWFVSYLYNHRTRIPFKYTPPTGYEVVYFDAEITKNPWEPDCDGVNLPQASHGAYAEPLNKQLGNGFLSLRAVSKVVVTLHDCGMDKWPGYDSMTASETSDNIQINNNFFFGTKGTNTVNEAIRTYYVDGRPDDENTKEEAYSYQKHGESVSMSIPLFTRAKVLVKETGYSGNNPYVEYTRTAEITMTPYLRKIGTDDEPVAWNNKKIINVVQVQRLVNPKGVYRRSGNFEPFHVQLKILNDQNAPTFEPLISHGTWMAEVLGDDNFITINGSQTVYGSTESEVDFTIRFNRLNNDNKVRNAVVRVLYNSYTCTHLIFVRQGYDEQEIVPEAVDLDNPTGGATPVKWGTFNRISASLDATDPRDEGSMFKYGNSGQPIDAVNNCYGDPDGDGVGDYSFPDDDDFYNDSRASKGNYFIVNADGSLPETTTKWADIKKNSDNADNADKGFTKMEGMATMRDFEQLYTSPHMQFGYGVLYADGATNTADNIQDAYGYYRRDPANKKNAKGELTPDSHKGMRGVFAYYYDQDNPGHSYTGKNVFFPIGRAGYGGRKQGGGKNENPNYFGLGILRYNTAGYNSRGETFNKSAPLMTMLYYQNGAIYYARESVTSALNWTGEKDATCSERYTAVGMDMNYYTFDVNLIYNTNLLLESTNGNACFVRFVKR
ncbi:MAG: hypothetical protein K2L55_04670 [Muribaculaceae bacterium]|nr:hypothetical protein [Muribaculaceae bacterium]